MGIFGVTEEAEGGFVAECLAKPVFSQADTWDQLRDEVKDAMSAYFFDGAGSSQIRLRQCEMRSCSPDEASPRSQRCEARPGPPFTLGLCTGASIGEP